MQKIIIIATLLLALAQPLAARDYTIVVSNTSGETIEIVVTYKSTNGVDWINTYDTRGWITLEHWSEVTIGVTASRVVYIHARSADGSTTWGSKSEMIDFGTGDRLPAIKTYWTSEDYPDGNTVVTRITSDGWDYPWEKPLIKIKFTNECDETVSVALYYMKDGEWVSDGWWEIEPGETEYLEDTRNRIFYYYASSRNGTWSGNYYHDVGGKRYGFKKIEIDAGSKTYTKTLTCDD
jgi:uncharacterized membrane protein